MNLTQQVENFILQAIPQLYHQEIDLSLVQIQKTKKDILTTIIKNQTTQLLLILKRKETNLQKRICFLKRI